MGLEETDGNNEKKLILQIVGMNCPHCSATVQRALEAVPGVKSVSVDLAGGRAEVIYSGESNVESLLHEAVVKAGFISSIAQS